MKSLISPRQSLISPSPHGNPGKSPTACSADPSNSGPIWPTIAANGRFLLLARTYTFTAFRSLLRHVLFLRELPWSILIFLRRVVQCGQFWRLSKHSGRDVLHLHFVFASKNGMQTRADSLTTAEQHLASNIVIID
jgi:hypothetical protein